MKITGKITKVSQPFFMPNLANSNLGGCFMCFVEIKESSGKIRQLFYKDSTCLNTRCFPSAAFVKIAFSEGKNVICEISNQKVEQAFQIDGIQWL